MPLPFLPDGSTCAVIGMLHVPALPGTPRHDRSLAEITDMVLEEAAVYADSGVDAVMLENMHDVPYLRGEVGPEITASMTSVAQQVGEVFPGPVGVQVLAGANQEALAVALAAGLQFVRVEGFVFGHVADEGWLDASAGPLLRYRRQIGADHVAVLADIKKKHSAHAVTSDVSLAETAQAAAFCGADGVIVTGGSTGEAAQPDDLLTTQAATSLPVLVGSGVNSDNVHDYRQADGLIVGSSLKVGGAWDAALDPARLAEFLDKVALIR